MKMMQGAFFCLVRKRVADSAGAYAYQTFLRSRSRRWRRTGVWLRLRSRGRAKSLPVPGGPTSRPRLLGMHPQLLEFLGSFRNSNNFLKFFFGFIGAGYIFGKWLFLLAERRRARDVARSPQGLCCRRLASGATQEKTLAYLVTGGAQALSRIINPIPRANFFDFNLDALVFQLLW